MKELGSEGLSSLDLLNTKSGDSTKFRWFSSLLFPHCKLRRLWWIRILGGHEGKGGEGRQ